MHGRQGPMVRDMVSNAWDLLGDVRPSFAPRDESPFPGRRTHERTRVTETGYPVMSRFQVGSCIGRRSSTLTSVRVTNKQSRTHLVVCRRIGRSMYVESAEAQVLRASPTQSILDIIKCLRTCPAIEPCALCARPI